MDWITAISKLTGRCRESRKVGNNTYLHRRPQYPNHTDDHKADDAVALRLHNTDVLTWYSDGRIELNNGGYPTRTTHDRMNQYLPPGYRVSGEPLETSRSDGGMTVLRHGTHVWQGFSKYSEVTVDTHATINPDGTLDGGDVAKYREERRQARLEANRPRNRARYWANKVREGKTFKGTVADIMAEDNATVRVAKIRCYGLEKFFLDAKTVVIDERAGYQLLELPLDRWRTMRALKMACTTTGAVYINAVPEHIRTVPAGLDWMFDTRDYLGTIGQQS
jgi:hypothetical protein